MPEEILDVDGRKVFDELKEVLIEGLDYEFLEEWGAERQMVYENSCWFDSDFYENLGINIMADPAKTCGLIQKTNFGFLMATVYHSAMRFAAPVRKALGIKTIMNIMGPLLNPAGAEYEVLGVYTKDLLETYGRAAKKLGAKRVLVVTSEDGFDEISPCAPTYCFQINEDGKEYKYVIDPAKYGITDDNPEELAGGNGAENAALAMDLLNGKRSAAMRITDSAARVRNVISAAFSPFSAR